MYSAIFLLDVADAVATLGDEHACQSACGLEEVFFCIFNVFFDCAVWFLFSVEQGVQTDDVYLHG